MQALNVSSDRHGWDVPTNNVARGEHRLPEKAEYTASRSVHGCVNQADEILLTGCSFYGRLGACT